MLLYFSATELQTICGSDRENRCMEELLKDLKSLSASLLDSDERQLINGMQILHHILLINPALNESLSLSPSS